MAGKLLLLIGFGAGYLLGARAGREQYDMIAGKAQGVWHDPRVQHKVGQAQHLVADNVGSGPRGGTSMETGA